MAETTRNPAHLRDRAAAIVVARPQMGDGDPGAPPWRASRSEFFLRDEAMQLGSTVYEERKTMIRSVSIVLSLGVSACSVEQAPGTRPADMSARAHIEECKKHLAIAEEQEQRARYMYRVRGVVTAAHAGEREREIAKQHQLAARTLDPKAPACP